MTAPTVKNDTTAALRVARTGWRKARIVREKGVRTCISPVEDGSCPPTTDTAAEPNIVRGDD
ncbi:hypothetical protein OG866_18940 [Streptomyces sp. NBC_00663]|uniref:hypothetical protein n=1 Tax=Streptomyces sp. NBC_00663 TaxID=2975801 RepID=UPI002E348121|nr:hypothetical protein [Streptomyces sp. NBC_00663]